MVDVNALAAANAKRKMGPDGLAIVKAFESCMAKVPGQPGRFKAYYDPVNVLTIGWGHTNHHLPRFDAATVWTQEQCDAVLAGDMKTFEDHVNRLAKVDLKQHEFDALVSWAFNTGGPATASLWRQLNSGNKDAIPANLAQWNKAGGRVLNGLTRRRKAEGLLFQGRIKEAYQVAQAKMSTAAKVGSTTAVVVGTAGGAAVAVSQGWTWIEVGLTAFIAAGFVTAFVLLIKKLRS
jgi:lysozyme